MAEKGNLGKKYFWYGVAESCRKLSRMYEDMPYQSQNFLKETRKCPGKSRRGKNYCVEYIKKLTQLVRAAEP